MIEIRVTDNLKEVTKGLDSWAKRQVPFATARALTRTGQDAAKELKSVFGDVFSGVSPFVANSPFSTVATKARPEVTVGVRDQNKGRASPADYVKEHFAGGPRGNKPMEKAMHALGAMPAGWLAVPGSGLKLDRNGNPNRKQVVEILGALKAGMRVFSGRGKRMQDVAYFVRPAQGATAPQVRHLRPGIYRRTGAGKNARLVQMFAFVRQADYSKVIDLPRLARSVVARRFNAHFADELAKAMATAR